MHTWAYNRNEKVRF